MLTSNEPNNSENRSEMLKPNTRSLLEAIVRTTETTGMANESRVARMWVHVDLLM
jgi:hypothetical protein